MLFEWDEAKREINLFKHGVDFRRVRVIFDGRPIVTERSDRNGEERLKTTGELNGRFFTVVWTPRGNAIRIISARRARDGEERAYRAVHHTGAR
jgi:uncharacterized protein